MRLHRKSQLVLLFPVIALTAGCVTGRPATRYTWTCATGSCVPDQLTQDHATCAEEAKSESKWTPAIAANAILRTLYKDCMEKRGYIKAKSAEGVRYQSQNGKFSLSPESELPSPGEVDLILWF